MNSSKNFPHTYSNKNFLQRLQVQEHQRLAKTKKIEVLKNSKPSELLVTFCDKERAKFLGEPDRELTL